MSELGPYFLALPDLDREQAIEQLAEWQQSGAPGSLQNAVDRLAVALAKGQRVAASGAAFELARQATSDRDLTEEERSLVYAVTLNFALFA